MLEDEGIAATTPRQALEEAYLAGWLEDKVAWLQMLRDRNATPHVCDEEAAKRIYENVRAFCPQLEQTYANLVARAG